MPLLLPPPPGLKIAATSLIIVVGTVGRGMSTIVVSPFLITNIGALTLTNMAEWCAALALIHVPMFSLIVMSRLYWYPALWLPDTETGWVTWLA